MLAAVLGLGLGCGGTKPSAAPGRAVERISEASDRESLAVTVYNDGFGLIRETRQVRLVEGIVSLSYRDVAQSLEPETLQIRSLESAGALQVLDQNYRFDPLTPATLLEKYLGRKIRVHQYNERLAREEAKVAEVLASRGGVVLRVDGQVTSASSGRLAFPEVPENLVAKPTLVWRLLSRRVAQRMEVSYLARGLRWQADYVLALDAEDRTADLSGWVTLENRSGTGFKKANLRVVAGDVHRVESEPRGGFLSKTEAPGNAAPFRQEKLFEYHLYTLERPTDLADKEQKQVSLLEATGITLDKRLLLRGDNQVFRSRQPVELGWLNPSVYLAFANSTGNRLGMPLPKGVLRVYKTDASGVRYFIGENELGHTPRDEQVRFRLGETSEVQVERAQLQWRSLGNCAAESAWEIRIHNHKDSAERLELEEHAAGEWQVLSASHPVTRKDAQSFVFEVPLKAQAKEKLTYRVLVRWC